MVIEDYTYIYKGKEHLKVDKFLEAVAFPENFTDTSSMTIGAYSIFGGLSPESFISFLDSVAESLINSVKESGSDTEISDLKIIIEHKVNNYVKTNGQENTVYTHTFYDVCFTYILYKIKILLKKRDRPPIKNKSEANTNDIPFNTYIKNMPVVTQADLDWSLIAINTTAQVAAIDAGHILSSLNAFIKSIADKIDNPGIKVSHVKEQIQVSDTTLAYHIFEYVCQKIKLDTMQTAASTTAGPEIKETGSINKQAQLLRSAWEQAVSYKDHLMQSPLQESEYIEKYTYITTFPGLDKISAIIRPLFIERFGKICNEVYSLLKKDKTHTTLSIRLYILSGFKDFFREYSIDVNKLNKDFYESCYITVSYVLQEMFRGEQYGIKALEIVNLEAKIKNQKGKNHTTKLVLIFILFIVLGLLILVLFILVLLPAFIKPAPVNVATDSTLIISRLLEASYKIINL